MNLSGILNLAWIFVLILHMSGCKAIGSGGSGGSTTTTFLNPDALQISNLQGLPTGILVGKFTDDNYDDLVVLTTTGMIFYESVEGTSWKAATFFGSGNCTAGHAANIMSGAELDLIVMQGGTIVIYEAKGDGTFSQSSTLARGRTVTGLSSGKFKSSNDTWIFAATSSGNPYYVDQENGTFGGGGSDFGSAESSIKSLAADFDSDGFIDTALVAKTSAHINIFENETETASDEANSTFAQAATINTVGSLLNATLVQFTSNSDILVSTNSGLQLYKNTGAFNFSADTVLKPAALAVAASDILAVDFTKDDEVDLFLLREGSTSVLYSQTSDLAFTNITTEAFGSDLLTSGPLQAAAGDIDGDGAQDIVEVFINGTISVHINQAGK